MSIYEIVTSLEEANFDCVIQMYNIEEDEEYIFYDGNIAYVDLDEEVLQFDINFMFPENNKIIFEIEYTDDLEDIDSYKIED